MDERVPTGKAVYVMCGTHHAPTGETFKNGYIALQAPDRLEESEEDYHGIAWTNLYRQDGSMICSLERMSFGDVPEWIEWADKQKEFTLVSKRPQHIRGVI